MRRETLKTDEIFAKDLKKDLIFEKLFSTMSFIKYKFTVCGPQVGSRL